MMKKNNNAFKFKVFTLIIIILSLFCMQAAVSAAESVVVGVPKNLKVNYVSPDEVLIEWEAPADSEGLLYLVYDRGQLIDYTTQTSCMIHITGDGTAYEFSVRAEDSNGNISSFSNVVCIYHVGDGTPPIPAVPPAAPTGLVLNSVFDKGAVISWDMVENVLIYEVFCNGSLLGRTTDTSYTVNGLKNGTGYVFTVYALGRGGSRSESSNGVYLYHVAESLGITANVSVLNRTVTVSGTIGAGANRGITLEAFDSNGTVIFNGQCQSTAYGRFETKFDIPETAKGGIYTLKLTGEGVDDATVVTFEYFKTIEVVNSLNCKEGNEFYILISGKNQSNITSRIIEISYDAQMLDVVDLVADTSGIDLLIGNVVNSNINIIEFDPLNGFIKLKCTTDTVTSDIINSIKFYCKFSGQTNVKVTVK